MFEMKHHFYFRQKYPDLPIHIHTHDTAGAAVASMLYMSESSLRRRLQQEETSYQAIKDEVRCELAIDKIVNENAKVADLAELLGFTEASSFVRSFKSWTGHTPRSYREKMLSLRDSSC